MEKRGSENKNQELEEQPQADMNCHSQRKCSFVHDENYRINHA